MIISPKVDGMSHRSFLPLAPTFVTKALTRVLSLAIPSISKRPLQSAIQLIALSCNGDLRSAVNSLQLMCSRSLTDFKKRKRIAEDELKPKKKGLGSHGGKGMKVDVSDDLRAVSVLSMQASQINQG